MNLHFLTIYPASGPEKQRAHPVDQVRNGHRTRLDAGEQWRVDAKSADVNRSKKKARQLAG